ncbi:MAG: sodium-dependent transporter [Ruminococcaceae bacterium]|nr:sodium-dependent transporter [Oscillospiraceae bacterium]
MSEKRSNFTGKIGFVLAAAGSAVGLGNIWRFPYLAAKYGGGIFLLVYIALAVTFGFVLMCAEVAIGRKTGLSAIGAYKALDKRFGFVGWLASIVPMIILPYYSVIGGWVTKYISVYISGQAHAAADDSFFGGFISSPIEPVGWFLLFIGITALIVLFGVEKGIERVSKWMMPILAILTVIIAIYGLFMPGAIDGLIYYIKPDFSHFSATTVLAAMGQLFYSMSLAMGIMITYGSYMKKDIKLESSVRQIELFDTGIAFLAGLMIIPAVFAFSGGDPEVLSKGAGLMFITLPKVFDSMTGGPVIGLLFFVMVFFAALTSSISLMETVVSIIKDKTKLGRKTICGIVFAGSVALGIPSSLGNGLWSHIKIANFDILGVFDFASNSVIMPIVALLTCIFVGYVIKPQAIIEEIELTGKFTAKKMFTVIIKYVAPIFIVGILIFSVLEGLGVIKV